MRLLKGIINFFVYIAIAAIAAMLVITFLDVAFRLTIARPITGATEICEILMAVMLTAMGGSLLAGKTVQVDVMLDAIPKNTALIIDTVTLIVSAVFCVFVGWATILNSFFSMQTHRSYTFIGIAQWPFLTLLGCSFIIAGIAVINFIIVLHQNKDRKKSVLDHADLAILEEIEE
jgi:TRAP-type C4-dicarboxylate transport system permease small subunit